MDGMVLVIVAGAGLFFLGAALLVFTVLGALRTRS